jgi:hypothetical protein
MELENWATRGQQKKIKQNKDKPFSKIYIKKVSLLTFGNSKILQSSLR